MYSDTKVEVQIQRKWKRNELCKRLKMSLLSEDLKAHKTRKTSNPEVVSSGSGAVAPSAGEPVWRDVQQNFNSFLPLARGSDKRAKVESIARGRHERRRRFWFGNYKVRI
jgi:hypothetical protein